MQVERTVTDDDVVEQTSITIRLPKRLAHMVDEYVRGVKRTLISQATFSRSAAVRALLVQALGGHGGDGTR